MTACHFKCFEFNEIPILSVNEITEIVKKTQFLDRGLNLQRRHLYYSKYEFLYSVDIRQSYLKKHLM